MVETEGAADALRGRPGGGEAVAARDAQTGNHYKGIMKQNYTCAE